MAALASEVPTFVAEWHPTKNAPLDPSDFAISSHAIVWWMCGERHEFKTRINSRFNSGRGITSCPICAHRRVLAGYNDLETRYPAIAVEWDRELNVEVSPGQVAPGSKKEFWWKCPLGHSYKSPPNRRTSNGAGCPFCGGVRVLRGFNDLASRNPEIALEWDDSLNAPMSAAEVSASSSRKYWWKCKTGHKFEATVNNRTSARGSGCPYCAGRKLLIGFNDLLTKFPRTVRFWSYELNQGLSPREVLPSSNQVVWWKCEFVMSHTWQEKISNRLRSKTDCTMCTGKVVIPGFNDLGSLQDLEWNWSRNHVLNPAQFHAGSGEKLWWVCQFGHEWRQSPAARRLNREEKTRGCPYCSNRSFKAGYNDIATRFPELLRIWDVAMNLPNAPHTTLAGGQVRYWWTCQKVSEHRFIASVPEVASGVRCAVCSGRQVQYGVNDLATLRPEIASEFDEALNPNIQPSELTAYSNMTVWWRCSLNHPYRSRVASRSLGSGCPVCDNKKVLAGYNDLYSMNPLLAAQWHPTKNGDLRPADVIVGTTRSIWWQCDQGHEWQVSPAQRLSGTNCPGCANFGFDRNAPATLYFIHHQVLKAMKIGITGSQTSRLDKFVSRGWKILHLVRDDSGEKIHAIENELLRWLKVDNQLTNFLGRQELRGMGGWTETFADDAISASVVKRQIDLVVESFSVAR